MSKYYTSLLLHVKSLQLSGSLSFMLVDKCDKGLVSSYYKYFLLYWPPELIVYLLISSSKQSCFRSFWLLHIVPQHFRGVPNCKLTIINSSCLICCSVRVFCCWFTLVLLITLMLRVFTFLWLLDYRQMPWCSAVAWYNLVFPWLWATNSRLASKQPHTITLPPPCFTAGSVWCFSNVMLCTFIYLYLSYLFIYLFFCIFIQILL